MYASRPLDRRTFIADLGRGAFALAVLGVAACAPAGQGIPLPASPTTAAPEGSNAAASAASGATPAPASEGASAQPSSGAPGSPPPASGGGGLSWRRANLGFVSAYVLVRAGEAAIVDTGVAGSADAIGEALTAAGLDWSAVAHLILTHKHADHAGSAAAVLERAAGAKGYAGAEDIAAISVPRPLTAVADGDRVFDLQIVTAPGHTAGSICVFDAAAGILVAGDALRTEAGRPIGPSAQFSADMARARGSVAKLAKLQFETLLVGHGDPLDAGADAAVAELAAQL
jgi:glyoxylase-like metal-dependent hydrolase (beta-lactamase superfamily II)